MSTPNAPELRRVLAHVETLPVQEGERSWDQTVYRCQTGMCFAGWASELNGGVWAGPLDLDAAVGSFLLAVPDDDPSLVYSLSDGRSVISARSRAQRILGLDEYQGLCLFDGCNSLADLRRIVAELCAVAEGGAA